MNTSNTVENELEVWRTELDDYIQGLHWSSDTKWLCITTSSGKVVMIETEEEKVLPAIQAHKEGILASDISPTTPLLATGGVDGKVKLWRMDREIVKELDAGSSWVEQIGWSPDGQFLATGVGRTLKVWTKEGELLFFNNDHESTIAGIAWRSDSKVIATTCYGSVKFFSIEGKALTDQYFWQNSMISLSFSPDGKNIVAGTQDNQVHFWPIPFTPENDLQMSGYAGKVKNPTWDHKSSFLATESFNQVIIWSFQGKSPAGQQPKVLSGHESKITKLSFQHKEDLLISGDQQGTLLFWIPSITEMALTGQNLRSEITALKWSPDDLQLAAGTKEGEVVIFDSPA